MSERSKPFAISKSLIWQAYLKIKENGGTAGIDRESIEEFNKKRDKNLYKIWNRLTSGSYFPPPVLGVNIPKKSGGLRVLGIPSVSDRIAQMSIKLKLEPILEPIFDVDSYGYRPNKSPHHAVEVTRRRCWKYKWVVEFDIKGLFDHLSHDLLMKALRHHTSNKWIIMYIKRWLEVPIKINGILVKRDKGTPQGGVISPLLANLFLHYCFDTWMRRHYPNLKFCRYADDGLVHCDDINEAKRLLQDLKLRIEECGLELHPDKTSIVYCKTQKRNESYSKVSFDFLGFTFKPRGARDKEGKRFLSFLPGVSKSSLSRMIKEVKKWKIYFKSRYPLSYFSYLYNPIITGWYNYYSKFYKTALYPLWYAINWNLIKWAMWKYKKLSKWKAVHLIGKISEENKKLFTHWKFGIRPTCG